MRKLILTMMAVFAMTINAQNLFVGTYNIRNNSNNGDVENGNGWNQRLGVITGQVLFEQPDIFGTQEVLHGQVVDLKNALTGYDYIGVGRDDGKEEGEYECIWYKNDKLRLLDSGNFWLSETPDRPGLGWDAACIRICSWGKFAVKDNGANRKVGKHGKNKNEGTFYFFNLHMDHVGIVARREAAKLVVEKIREIAQGAPAILTGDFNVDQNNEIYNIFTDSGILKDSFVEAKQRFAENGTFNSFHPELKTQSRIDHIFVSPCVTVEHYAVMTNCYWTERQIDEKEVKGKDAPRELRFKRHQMRTPSDHYPVWAKIKL